VGKNATTYFLLPKFLAIFIFAELDEDKLILGIRYGMPLAAGGAAKWYMWYAMKYFGKDTLTT
jgi:hypothetical protein